MNYTSSAPLICLLVLLSVLDYTSARGHTKEQAGSCKLSSRSVNERVVDLHIGEKRRSVELKKRELPVTSRRPSRKPSDVTVFCSSDDTVACLEECNNGKCISRCYEQTETGYSYIKDNKALTVESHQNKGDKCLLPPLPKKSKDARKGESAKPTKKTLMVPNVVNIKKRTGIIKLRLMVDSSFMKIFVDFVKGDTRAAKREVGYFLALSINRIASYYTSLKGHAVTFNSTDGVNFPLDLTVVLENITFPLQNATDGSFYDIDAIAKNRQGEGENTTLVMNYIYDEANGTLIGSTGLFADFADYLHKLYKGQTTFDIMHIITANDLVRDSYNLTGTNETVFIGRDPAVTGIAYTGAFCTDFKESNFDGRFGFVEFFVPYFDRTIAHELGHNLGAFHDGNEKCPSRNFTLMAPIALPKMNLMSDAYYNFSVCSAEEISKHFSSFKSDRIATCLYTNKPTYGDFVENYCKKHLGSRYNLNDHCKIFFGKDSFLCSEGNNHLEKGFVSTNNCQSVLNTDFSSDPLLTCAKDMSCKNSTNQLFHLFDGTRCLNKDGTEGHQICFSGKCVPESTLCRRRQKSAGIEKEKGKPKDNEIRAKSNKSTRRRNNDRTKGRHWQKSASIKGRSFFLILFRNIINPAYKILKIQRSPY